ncbi:hypothetical protein P3W45_000558 [Vairimorpha bombi]|jgi:hypothetical protein
MSDTCLICKSLYYIPHWLPCGHTFCFLCIRRHIEKRNFCPECLSSPYSPTDLCTNVKQFNKISKIPIIINLNEQNLKKELKKYRVDIRGDKNILTQRYRELSINVDNERYRDVPRNMDTIARQLNFAELQNRQIKKDIERDMEKAKEKLKTIKQGFLNNIKFPDA